METCVGVLKASLIVRECDLPSKAGGKQAPNAFYTSQTPCGRQPLRRLSDEGVAAKRYFTAAATNACMDPAIAGEVDQCGSV